MFQLAFVIVVPTEASDLASLSLPGAGTSALRLRSLTTRNPPASETEVSRECRLVVSSCLAPKEAILL